MNETISLELLYVVQVVRIQAYDYERRRHIKGEGHQVFLPK
jgi:hypothetical protein